MDLSSHTKPQGNHGKGTHQRKLHPDVSKNSSKEDYFHVVRKIMFVFGDSLDSLKPTVKMVEDYTQRQVKRIMEKVINSVKQAGRKKVTMNDVLLIYHFDPIKINRMQSQLNYNLPYIRSLKEYQKRRSLLEQKEWTKSCRKHGHILSLGEFENEVMITEQEKKKMEDLEKDKKEHEKLLSTNMTSNEYSWYLKFKNVSFLSVVENGVMQVTLRKFLDWIDYSNCGMKFDRSAVELLGIIAYETVGMITQTALIVQKDIQMSIQDRFEVSKGISSGIMNREMRKKYSSTNLVDEDGERLTTNFTVSMRTPIRSTHVIEGIRRINERKPHSLGYQFTRMRRETF